LKSLAMWPRQSLSLMTFVPHRTTHWRIVLCRGALGRGALSASNNPYAGTFASLGITPGTYTWGWAFFNGYGPPSGGGTFTLTTITTPLPAALPLFATGLGGLGLLGWRRKRKAQAVA
jgi:hypothetical protein